MNKSELARQLGKAFRLGYAFSRGQSYRKGIAQDEAKWITVHPNGKGMTKTGDKAKGQPVLIDGETGEVLGGMGGKFTGKHISAVPDRGKKEQQGAQAKIERKKAIMGGWKPEQSKNDIKSSKNSGAGSVQSKEDYEKEEQQGYIVSSRRYTAQDVKNNIQNNPYKEIKTKSDYPKAAEYVKRVIGLRGNCEFGSLSAQSVNDCVNEIAAQCLRMPELISEGYFQNFGTVKALNKKTMQRLEDDMFEQLKKQNSDISDNWLRDFVQRNLRNRKLPNSQSGTIANYISPRNASTPNETNNDMVLWGINLTDYGQRNIKNLQKFKETNSLATGSLRGTIAHEFGHSIDKALGIRDLPEIVKLYKDWLGTSKPSSLNYSVRNEKAKQLSAYGMDSPKEFVAECWAEYTTDPNPRELAKKVGAIIENQYKEKYGKAHAVQ